jgi:hypothetical protein
MKRRNADLGLNCSKRIMATQTGNHAYILEAKEIFLKISGTNNEKEYLGDKKLWFGITTVI